MKKIFILVGLLYINHSVSAQNLTITAQSDYVANNLDLNEVLKLYEESQNIKDFERKINFPTYSISNIDLNNDNKVDYLRAVENHDNGTTTIYIQSVLGRNKYEDIAYINTNTYSEPIQEQRTQSRSADVANTIQKVGFFASFFLNVLDIVLTHRR